MREILFKAKRTDTGDWVEGFLCKHPSAIQIGETSPWWIHVPPMDPDDKGGMFNVDPETVCQYTGLTDKNEIKAFENDKICDPYENRIFTIKWARELAAFFLMDDDGWMNKEIARLFYCEIIGNIHDKQGIKGGE